MYIFEEYNITMIFWYMYIHFEMITTVKLISISIIRFNFNEDNFGGLEMFHNWVRIRVP